jgi:2-phospho-L-lactate guanylyltransferase
MSWVVVVPVKGNPGAKTRLGGPDRAQLADAFALDTVAALLAAAPVLGVFVVTGDTVLGAELARLGATIVSERRVATGAGPAPVVPEDPLNAAIEVGLVAAAAAFPSAHRAVATGDLPALTAADVERALALAGEQERSFVPDSEGTGTTTLLALAGVPIIPLFGRGSRVAHEAAGYVPLALPARSGIRRDVDTPADLAQVERLGAGPHTSALLTAASARSLVNVSVAVTAPSEDRPLEK